MYTNLERQYVRGDIYFANIKGSGAEQDGCRPVIILQNNTGNKYSNSVIIATLTSKIKKVNMPTHVLISKGDGNLERDSIVQLEQIRTIDKKKLITYIGMINNKETIRKIDEAIKNSLAINNYDEDRYEKEKSRLKKNIESLDYLISFSLNKGADIKNLCKEIKELKSKVSIYGNKYKENYTCRYLSYIKKCVAYV